MRPFELILLQGVPICSRYGTLGAQEWRWLLWIPSSAVIASLLPKSQIMGDYVGKQAVEVHKKQQRR